MNAPLQPPPEVLNNLDRVALALLLEVARLMVEGKASVQVLNVHPMDDDGGYHIKAQVMKQ